MDGVSPQKAYGSKKNWRVTARLTPQVSSYDSNGVDVSNSYLEQVNATMPSRSEVYRDASNNLWLKIAPIRGMSIIFR